MRITIQVFIQGADALALTVPIQTIDRPAERDIQVAITHRVHLYVVTMTSKPQSPEYVECAANHSFTDVTRFSFVEDA
jgi:hypothetical protein